MSAGISQKRMNAIYYNRLKKIQHELEAAGVPTNYKQFRLYGFPSLSDNFSIGFRTLRASNGETAGLMNINIDHNGVNEVFFFPKAKPEDGIARIKQLFGKRHGKPSDYWVGGGSEKSVVLNRELMAGYTIDKHNKEALAKLA